jgi:hypothetical protein
MANRYSVLLRRCGVCCKAKSAQIHDNRGELAEMMGQK